VIFHIFHTNSAPKKLQTQKCVLRQIIDTRTFRRALGIFPDPEENVKIVQEVCGHTRILVCGWRCVLTQDFSLLIEKISRKFLENFWKILENCENFPVLFHIFLMYLKFSKPQTQDLVC
jgi:hypothetical protein